MPDLTEDQRKLIALKTKTNRPSYYDSKSKCRVAIGSETEEALILLGTEQKNKAAQYLKAFADKEDRSDTISEVLSLFNSAQQENAENSAIELQIAFVKFDAFKKALYGNGNDAFARGLAPVVQALSTGLGQLKSQIDRYSYDQRHLAAATSTNRPSLTLDQKKEILSWVSIIVSYT